MATPLWQANTFYPTGSIVSPTTTSMPPLDALTNPGFESGTADWTLSAGVAVTGDNPFQGSQSARFTGNSGSREVLHDPAPCVAGMTIAASCYYEQGPASVNQNTGWVFLRFYDAGMVQIGADAKGNVIIRGDNGAWHPSNVQATAPPGTAFVAVGCGVLRTNNPASHADNFTWRVIGNTRPPDLVFRAVQPNVGQSAGTEPNWPSTVGAQVIDNEVVWEGVLASQVTWQASPIMESGTDEPVWPTSIGGTVIDDSVQWTATARSVPGAPNSDLVLIAVSKVFVGDDDIVSFSATVNPLDRTTPDDAGFLATGLQQYGANPVAAMGLYRGNGVFFNAEAFQMWQLDEDPANQTILDALPIGSTWHYALCPVANDLLFLASDGLVRSIGIAGGSTNLQASDVGKPIDELTRAAVAALVALGYEPISLYYPGAGQFWLCCNDDDGCEVFVYTMNRIGQVGAWSRYLLPFRVDDWAIKGDSLYIRSGDAVHRMDDSIVGDQLVVGGPQVPFVGIVQWPWLDFGTPGATKRLIGVDVVCEGAPTISIGYDQRNTGAFTAPYTLPADSVPGMSIPMEVTAPSMSVRLAFTGLERWEFKSCMLYFGNGQAAW